MKTIIKNGNYERVDNETGEYKVRNQGWKFSPKSDWKKEVRDVEKAARIRADREKAEAKAEKLSQKVENKKSSK
jgi:hypothetical protein